MNLDAARLDPRSTDALVHAGVSTCEGLLAVHLDAVRLRFGAAGLGVIDLPALSPEPLVPAQVRAGAALLWCREVERTGLLRLVETLAERLAAGQLQLPLTTSANRILRFWRGRHQRFAASEREALYRRIFDSGEGPDAFDAWLTHLVAAIAELGRRRRDLGVADVRARIGTLATDIGLRVSDRSVGIAAFAARDIVRQIREALSILGDPDLLRALGGGPVWMALRRHAPHLLGHTVEVSRHIDRATAGLAMLRWIADAAPTVHGAAQRLTRADPLVSAAERWRAVGGPTP